jgi:hypothetical protein
MIRQIPILILLLSCTATASPRPTPIPGERASEFTNRYYTWLDTIPMDDRAWEELQRIDAVIHEALDEFGGPTCDPYDGEQWIQTVRFIEQNQELMDAIRTNAAKPELGMPITESTEAEIYSPPETAIGILLPHLSMIKNQSKLLVADMILAAEEKKTERCMLDARALTNLCRHIPQTNTAIEYLVSIASTNLLYYPFLIDRINPDLFTSAQLEDLDHLIAESSLHILIADAGTTEQFMMLDMIHWFYEGSTDGRITPKGAKRLIDFIESESFIDENGLSGDSGIDEPTKIMKALKIQPKLARLDEQLAYANTYYEAFDKVFRTPLHALKAYTGSAIIEATISNTTDSMKFLPCVIFAADLTKAIQYRIHNDTKLNATRLLLAAHRHKLTHGHFPETLEDFDPAILTFTPTDLFTGQPLNYDILVDEPLIYSNGTDRDDDNAAPAIAHDFIPLNKLNEIHESDPASIDGDWILYPTTK